MGYPVVVYLMGVDLSGRNCYPTPAYHCVGWHMVVCYGGPEWFRRGCEGRRKRRQRTPDSAPIFTQMYRFPVARIFHEQTVVSTHFRQTALQSKENVSENVLKPNFVRF